MKNLIYLIILLMGPALQAHVIPNNKTHHHHHDVIPPVVNCILEGRVTESATGEPILFGDVAIYKNDVLITGTQTDLDGNYKIANLVSGIYTVKATSVGFSPKEVINLSLIKGIVTRLDITLDQGIELDEVIIKEYKVPLIEVSNTSSSVTLTAEQIQNSPTKNINALGSLTARLASGKGNKVRARGSRKSKETAYYMDGIPVKGKKRAKIAAESTRIAKVSKAIEENLSNKLTATEVNDFADWSFWSDIQETDFIQTSVIWNMNPQNRFSIQLKNTDGYALSGLHVELLDDEGIVLWKTVSDNLGKAELFAEFEASENTTKAQLIRISNDEEVIDEIEAVAFTGNMQTLTINETCQTNDMLELAFMMDISGSMGDEMAYLRSEITSIIDRLAIQYPNKKIRAGVVYFQGHGDKNTIRAHQLTDDIEHLNHFIKSQYGGGGSDEAIDLALQTMVEFEWTDNSTKIAFLMGDEELNNVAENRARQRLYTKKSAEVGIKLVPIGCSGMPKSLEYIMRTMAIVTGGTYIALTDHSGIGGQHTKPTTSAIDVKSLNDIIFDVVTRFSHSISCDFSDPNLMAHKVNSPHENLNKKYGESNPDQKIKLFPNPTAGPFSIKNRNQNKFDEMFVCDLAGRIVRKLDIMERHFDISDLAMGNYFLLYKSKDGSFGAEPIIKVNETNIFAQN